MKLNKALCIALSTSVFSISAEAAELRMSWWGGDSRNEATQQALEICGDKHGHEIQPEFSGWSDHLDILADHIANETEADIMQVNWPWLPLFSPYGEGFADLNELSHILQLDNWGEDELNSSVFGDRLNGLPASTNGRILVVNKTAYEKAGLEVPTTFEEMAAAAPKFKETHGDEAYLLTTSSNNASLLTWAAAIQTTGKGMIDPETRTVNWTQEELANAILEYKSLVDQGIVESVESAEAGGRGNVYEDPRWAEGKIASSIQWASTIGKASKPVQEGQELVAVKIPMFEGAHGDSIFRKPSMVFAISNHSDDPEAAAQILNCLLNEPEGIAALATTRGIPASNVAKQQLLNDGAISKVLSDAQEMVMTAQEPKLHPVSEHPDLKNILDTTLEAFAKGEIDAGTAAGQIIEKMNSALSEIYS